MAQISLADITKLRKATSAGMMDCKKALEEANGDFEQAVDIIRKKGQLVASKRAEREATEGVVLAAVSSDSKFGAVVALNCETDFVAKNEQFVALVQTILDAAIANKPASLDALKAIVIDGRTIDAHITERVGVTGEKMELSYYDSVKSEKVIPYIHPGNQLACIVGFTKVIADEQVYKDIAMQVAAMAPVAVDKDFVSQDRIEKELEIGRDQARAEGKPENMVDKIAEGKLNKFFKENTLLNQDFIKDNKKNIKQYLQGVDKDLNVVSFCRFGLKN